MKPMNTSLRSLLFVLLLACALPGRAQSPRFRWQHAYGNGLDTGGHAVKMPAGGYMLLAERAAAFGSSVLRFVRTNAQGDTLWSKTVRPRGMFHPWGLSMLVDNAGNLLVTGAELVGVRRAFATKLTPTCDTIWSRLFQPDGPNSDGKCAWLPTLLSDGNYALTVWDTKTFNTNPVSYQLDNIILKLNSTNGNTMWALDLSMYASLFGPLRGDISAMTSTSTGILVIIAASRLVGGNYNSTRGTWLINNNGTPSRYLDHIDQNLNPAPRTARTSNGSVVVAGRQVVTRLTAIGDTLWSTVVPPRIPGRIWDARGVVEDSRGDINILAQSTFMSNDTQLHLLRLNGAGRVLNDTLLYRAPENFGSSLLLAANDELVLSGYVTSAPVTGGQVLFMAQFRGFGPLATRAGGIAAVPLVAYPNPVGAGVGAVRVSLPPHPAATLAVLDGLGRCLRQQPLRATATEVEVPVQDLAPGLYFLRLTAADGRAWHGKLLRE